MRKANFIVFLILLSVSSSHAATNSKNINAIDVGGYVTNLDQRLSLSSELASSASSILGFVRFRRSMSLGRNFFFEPSFAVAVPWRAGVDGSVKIIPHHYDFALRVPVVSFLQLRLGPGIYSTLMISSDVDVQMPNGTGTATYHVPGAAQLTYSFSFVGGVQFKFSRVISLNMDIFVMDPLSSVRRNYNGAASFGVAL